jgi:hypothetical protein
MSHGRKAELGAYALAILLEESTCKLGPVVHNDTAWDPESVDDRLEEGNNSTLGVTPGLEGKPNANHVRARISNSRTQQLHNMDIITQCSNSIKKGNNSRLHHMYETST